MKNSLTEKRVSRNWRTVLRCPDFSPQALFPSPAFYATFCFIFTSS